MNRSILRKISKEEYALNFNTRATTQHDSIDKQLENFDYMLEDIILDFKYNKNVIQSYEFLQLFRQKFDDHLDRQASNYSTDQVEYATKVCRKANETYYFNLIREKYFAQMNVNPAVNHESEKVKNQVEAQVEVKAEVQAEVQEVEDFTLPGVERVQQPIKVKAAPANNEDCEEVPKPRFELEDLETKQITIEDEKQRYPVKNSDKNQEKVKQFDEMLAKFQENVSTHKIDLAHADYEKIAELAESKGEMEESQRAYIEKKMKENAIIFKETERLYKDMIAVHKELSDEEGWNVEKVRKGMVVKYKAEKGESVSLKFEMEMDIPIMNLLALIYEVDLYTLWYPFLKKGTEIKTINRATKVAHIEMSFPSPVSNREGYFYGAGFDRLETNGTIFMSCKTIHDDPEMTQYYDLEIPETSKMVRLDLKFFAFEIHPISRDKSLIKAVANADPKLKFIPMTFLNWTIRKFSHLLIDKMMNKARNLAGSPWEKRIKENPAFYDWANQVAEGYFSKLESNSGNTRLP